MTDIPGARLAGLGLTGNHLGASSRLDQATGLGRLHDTLARMENKRRRLTCGPIPLFESHLARVFRLRLKVSRPSVFNVCSLRLRHL